MEHLIASGCSLLLALTGSPLASGPGERSSARVFIYACRPPNGKLMRVRESGRVSASESDSAHGPGMKFAAEAKRSPVPKLRSAFVSYTGWRGSLYACGEGISGVRTRAPGEPQARDVVRVPMLYAAAFTF